MKDLQNGLEIMRYSVYQFHMSDGAFDKINSVGWGGDFGEFAAEVEIQREVKYEGSQGFRPEMGKYFTKVAEIEAGDLEDVFRVGNIGPRTEAGESLTRVADRMHSVSVGDIIQTVDGYLWMVDPEGFECVGTGAIGEAA